MVLFGLFTVAVISQSLQIGYALTGMIGFSVNAVIVIKNEFASKWGKYKLTLPVKRADIVKSLFLNQLIWLAAGTLLAGIELCLSCLLHGCPFDQPVDIFSMFALGISMSLFMGAIFFPLFFIGGEERGEAFWIISLLCAFGIDFTIISIINDVMEPQGTASIIFGGLLLLLCSAAAFALSYTFTVSIFKKKEY